jgi:CTP synthase (UTP-ammonia lyase)
MSKKIVIINQATNYLTIGLANAFTSKFDSVSIITGSIHVQGEELNSDINITWISKWGEGSD